MQEPEKATPQTALVQLPSPTAWPMVLGLGITLIAAGLITDVTIAILGLLLSTMAAIGWFRNVLPHEQHEMIRVPLSAPDPVTESHLHVSTPGIERPTYSFTSGVEAGLAGAVAMAAVVALYSWIKFHGLWYGINLLAAGTFIGWTDASDGFLSQFHPQGFLAALAIHIMVSVLVGLLYGCILPIFPRVSFIITGVIAPIFWSGLAYSMMKSVSPILSDRMNWWWFVASQVAYGLAAGLVIHLRVKVSSAEYQALPFNIRAGLKSDEGRHSRPPTNHSGPPQNGGQA